MIDMFMGNLQGSYLDQMVGSTSSSFSDLVLAGERIKNMIKIGRIQNAASTSSVVKKPYVAYGKKREGEANETVVVRGKVPTYRVPYQQVVVMAPVQNQQPYVIPVNQQQYQQQEPIQNQQQQQRHQ